MDIGKIFFTYVKHKQFDFSLLVNGKSIERKLFTLILFKSVQTFCFHLEPEVKGIFLFTMYKFLLLCNSVHGKEEGK